MDRGTSVLKFKSQYLERKPHQSWLVFTQVIYPGQNEIWKCWFCGGRTGKPRETPSKEGNHQQQIQPTYVIGLESNPNSIGRGRALSPMRHPCSRLPLGESNVLNLIR